MCGCIGGRALCGVVYVRVCTVGVVGLGCGLKPLKSAAGTAVVAMADCSAAGSTEWLTERSYMAAWAVAEGEGGRTWLR